MNINRTFSISLAKMAITGTLCVAGVSTNASEAVQMEHSVYLGGLFLGSVVTDVVQDGKSYQISSKAQSNESLKWMFKWTANGTSNGSVGQDKLLPAYHYHKSAWNDKTRGATLNYSKNGKVDVELVGKKNANLQKYTPVQSESLLNSLDPMTMILSAVMKFENGEGCSNTYPVFDGRRRYDITLKDAGVKTFKSSKYSVFSGEARGCQISVAQKGGFKRVSDYKLTDPEQLVVWIAKPVDTGRAAPVRMQVQTDLGAMELHLERYSDAKVKLVSKTAQ